MALSRCGQPCTTRQLGSPRRERSLGVGVRLPVAGRRRITRPRAPAVVEHLVSALRIVVSVSSPRPPARLPSCPVPSHAPSPPAHIWSLLSSTRHPLPLAFGRRRGLNTVGFRVTKRCAPEPSPNPAPAHPFSTPAATVSDSTLGPAAGSTPVTILAALAALTPWPLLARAGTVSARREAEEDPPHDPCRAHDPPDRRAPAVPAPRPFSPCFYHLSTTLPPTHGHSMIPLTLPGPSLRA